MKIKRIFPILFVLISLCGCASTANMKSKKTTASANSELLPVGSVVSTKKSGTLIITGVAQIDTTNHLFVILVVVILKDVQETILIYLIELTLPM